MSVSSISDIIDEASMISLFSDEKIIIGNNFNISDMTSNDVDYLSKYIGIENTKIEIDVKSISDDPSEGKRHIV